MNIAGPLLKAVGKDGKDMARKMLVDFVKGAVNGPVHAAVAKPFWMTGKSGAGSRLFGKNPFIPEKGLSVEASSLIRTQMPPAMSQPNFRLPLNSTWASSQYSKLPFMNAPPAMPIMGKGLRPGLSLSEMKDMQIPNPVAEMSGVVQNRGTAGAVGLGRSTPFKAILPTEGRPTYLPPANTPRMMPNYFKGGVNPGQYGPTDKVFNMSSRVGGAYTAPNTGEVIKAIAGKSNRIITDVASVGVGPISAEDAAIEQFLIRAGYRSNVPGIWRLKNKKAWQKFISNPSKQVLPAGNLRPSNDKTVSLDQMLAYRDFTDAPQMQMRGRQSGKMHSVPSLGPDYYNSDISTKFLPLWYKKLKR